MGLKEDIVKKAKEIESEAFQTEKFISSRLFPIVN